MPLGSRHGSEDTLGERRPHDFYPTPVGLIRRVVELIVPYNINTSHVSVLDPGCGDGRWGKEIKNKFNGCYILHGIDIRPVKADHYDLVISETDYLEWNPDVRYDLIIGNPPYRLAKEFIEKSWNLLTPDGFIMFLLRGEFTYSQRRFNDLFRRIPVYQKWDCARRPSFTGDRKTDTYEYSMFVWHKSFNYKMFEDELQRYAGFRFMWSYDEDES